MKLPKLAIFDMDGLLFDTERVLMEENAKVMEEYGYHQVYEEYIQTIGTADAEFYGRLLEIHGPEYPAREISELSVVRETERLKRDGVPVKPGIPELLAFFRDRNVTCCVATSTLRREAMQFLEMAGLLPFFSFVVTSEEVEHSKPAPDIFLLACERGGASPEDALVLEDSQNGVLASYRAGIPVICIPDIKQPEPYYAEKAAVIVSSAEAVPALFDPIDF